MSVLSEIFKFCVSVAFGGLLVLWLQPPWYACIAIGFFSAAVVTVGMRMSK